jgi:hypothetical protein
MVRATDSTALGSVVDACCVDRQERKVARGTPVQSGLCATRGWLGCNCQLSDDDKLAYAHL